MLLQKFQQFMYGRYGGDKFSLFLLVIALVLSFLGILFWPVTLLADAGVSLCVVPEVFPEPMPRASGSFSLFCVFGRLFENWVKFQNTRFRERKTYKYFRCPQCKQRRRAPRGRGKIQVTCQKCGNVFQTKT